LKISGGAIARVPPHPVAALHMNASSDIMIQCRVLYFLSGGN